MNETWRIKVAALLLVIFGLSALLGIVSIAGMLVFVAALTGGAVKDAAATVSLLAPLGIALGVFSFVVAGALHKLKRWAYIAAIVIFLLTGAGNVVRVVGGDPSGAVPLALVLGGLLLLYQDRALFSRNKTVGV